MSTETVIRLPSFAAPLLFRCRRCMFSFFGEESLERLWDALLFAQASAGTHGEDALYGKSEDEIS